MGADIRRSALYAPDRIDTPPLTIKDKRLPLAVIQARTGSARLPGKVLADLCGRPVLAWLVERARMSRMLSGVVVATTTDRGDDAVAELVRAVAGTGLPRPSDRRAAPLRGGHRGQ